MALKVTGATEGDEIFGAIILWLSVVVVYGQFTDRAFGNGQVADIFPRSQTLHPAALTFPAGFFLDPTGNFPPIIGITVSSHYNYFSDRYCLS